MSKKDHLSIKIVTANKLSELASFLESEGAADLSKDEWLVKFKIFWDENPFFNGENRGWLIENENHKVVGFLGSVPVVYQVFGREVKAYWATTWFVSKAGRSKSLDLFRHFMRQKGILFDTTPSQAVERILSKRFKFLQESFVWTQIEYVIPCNPMAFARFVSSKSDKLGFIFYPLGFLFCLFLRILNFLATQILKLSRHKEGWEVSLISSIPEDIESLWKLCGNSDSLMLKRDRQTLNWLFFSSLQKSRKIFEIREDGCLIGLAAFKVCYRQNWSYLELLDFFLVDRLATQELRQIVSSLASKIFSLDKTAAYIRFYPLFKKNHSFLLALGFLKFEGRSKFYYIDKSNLDTHRPNVLGSPIDGDRALF